MEELFEKLYYGGKEETFDREEWKAKKQSEKEAVYQMIDETALGVVSTPESFTNYLNVQARMERYSVANALLIYRQFPNAVQLKGYDEWVKDGIYPKRNSEKINILEPAEYTKSDGTVGRTYNVKRVFDVSQTNSRQAPPQVNRDAKMTAVAMLNSSPIKVKVIDQFSDPNLKGYYDHEKSEIRIRRGLESSTQVFQVAAFEMAHSELGAGLKEYSRNDKAFAANCIAYMLCKKHGIDAGCFTINQLPENFKSMEAKEVRGVLTEIRAVMVEISDRIADELYRSRKARERADSRDR